MPFYAIKIGLKRLLDYKGRSSRSEFWWFALAFFSAIILMTVIDVQLETAEAYQSVKGLVMILGGALYTPFVLAFVALGVRRLHDTERSGWWLLLVGFHIASIFLIIMLCQKGTIGPNKFGNDPLSRDINWDKVETF